MFAHHDVKPFECYSIPCITYCAKSFFLKVLMSFFPCCLHTCMRWIIQHEQHCFVSVWGGVGNKNYCVPTEVYIRMWCFYVVCGFIVCVYSWNRWRNVQGALRQDWVTTYESVQRWLVGIALTLPLKQGNVVRCNVLATYMYMLPDLTEISENKKKYLTKPVIASALPFWLSPFPLTRPEPNIGTRTFLCQHLLLYSAFHTRKMDLLSNRWVVSLLVCVFSAGKFYCHYGQLTRPHFCSRAKCVSVSGA